MKDLAPGVERSGALGLDAGAPTCRATNLRRALGQFIGQRRLAHAGFAIDEHHGPGTTPRCIQPTLDAGEFPASPNEHASTHEAPPVRLIARATLAARHARN